MRKLLAFVVLLFASSGCESVSREDLPRLVKELKHQESRVRARAALSLADLGEEGADAVPALVAALSDENGGVRSNVAFALRKIDTPAARKALREASERPSR